MYHSTRRIQYLRHHQIGKVVDQNPPGVTLCANGRWSTNSPAPGVCSYNGGWIRNYPELSKTLHRKGRTGAMMIDAQEEPQTIEALGIYFDTTYTTRKGKTGDAFAVQFYEKPPQEVLNILRESRFWWVRKEGLWYAWDNPANREVLEVLPVIADDSAEKIAPVPTQLEPQKQEHKYQAGDQVLVEYRGVMFLATIKKVGRKYLYFDPAYITERTPDQVYPLDYRYQERLAEFKNNLIEYFGDKYTWYYNSIVNPTGSPQEADLSSLLKLPPYYTAKSAWSNVLSNDIRQAGYSSLREWVKDNLPEPADVQGENLPIMPKRGQRYSFEDYKKLQGKLWSAVRNKDSRQYFPGVSELVDRAQQLVQKTFDELGPIWFSYFVNAINPFRESSRIYDEPRDSMVTTGSPMGYLRDRWEIYVKDEFKNAEEQTVNEFLQLKARAVSRMSSDFQKYEYSYRPSFFTFNTNPLVFLEVVKEYNIRHWLFPKLYNVPAIHDPFRAREMGYQKRLSLDIGTITTQEYIEYNYYASQSEFKDKGGQKMRSVGFFDLIPSLIFNRTFDWKACIAADFDVNQCAAQDLPGWQQLNDRRWKYILYIEEAIRRRQPVSDQAYQDYEELLGIVGSRKPEGWQFNLTERSENTDQADGINYVLEVLGVKGIRSRKSRGAGVFWTNQAEGGTVYPIKESEAREELADQGFVHFDAIVKAGKSIIRNWGKSTTIERMVNQVNETAIFSFRVGDKAMRWAGKNAKFPILITNITPPNKGERFANVFYLSLNTIKNPNLKCCSKTQVNLVYPFEENSIKGVIHQLNRPYYRKALML